MTLAYTTGTITLTNNSATVTGIGTGWVTALITGGVIYPEADGNSLSIKTVNSNTSITADTKWKGATGHLRLFDRPGHGLSPADYRQRQCFSGVPFGAR